MITSVLRNAKAAFYENFESVRQTIPTDRPVISFTFDDAALSSMSKGTRLLESAGFESTFYLCGNMALLERKEHGRNFMNVSDAIAVKNAGHQIACHTYSHNWLGVISAQDYADDCARNRSFWEEHLGERLQDFSYPLGKVSLAGKRLLKHHYKSLRGISHGINRNRTDMAYLRSVGISNGTFDKARIQRLVDDCTSNGGWLIFFAHGIDETDPQPFDTTTRDFKWVLDITRASGARVLSIEKARQFLMTDPDA